MEEAALYSLLSVILPVSHPDDRSVTYKYADVLESTLIEMNLFERGNRADIEWLNPIPFPAQA